VSLPTKENVSFGTYYVHGCHMNGTKFGFNLKVVVFSSVCNYNEYTPIGSHLQWVFVAVDMDRG
jgi:hypothetical protein